MKKHYKLTNDCEEYPTTTIYRIQALVDLPQHGVKAGDLGGFVESYENLSDAAWVGDDAKVFGDAKVYGNARVSGNARVLGNAHVYGDAEVSGNVTVFDRIIVGDKSRPVTKWDIRRNKCI